MSRIIRQTPIARSPAPFSSCYVADATEAEYTQAPALWAFRPPSVVGLSATIPRAARQCRPGQRASKAWRTSTARNNARQSAGNPLSEVTPDPLGGDAIKPGILHARFYSFILCRNYVCVELRKSAEQVVHTSVQQIVVQKCLELLLGFGQRNFFTGSILKIIHLLKNLADLGKRMPRYDLAQVNQCVAVEFQENFGMKLM